MQTLLLRASIEVRQERTPRSSQREPYCARRLTRFDSPDDLAADLSALAGPSAGPTGGSIFVDGFSGGQLPPKESIREIRINQNPFSPEYDKLGYGKIEIFTKPGSDKYRGNGAVEFRRRFLEHPQPLFAQ